MEAPSEVKTPGATSRMNERQHETGCCARLQRSRRRRDLNQPMVPLDDDSTANEPAETMGQSSMPAATRTSAATGASTMPVPTWTKASTRPAAATRDCTGIASHAGPGSSGTTDRLVAMRPATSSYINGRRQRGRRVERWSNGRLMRHNPACSRETRVQRAIEQMNQLLQTEVQPSPQLMRTALIRYSQFASASDVSATWLALQERLVQVEAKPEHAVQEQHRQERADKIALETWSSIFTQLGPYTGERTPRFGEAFPLNIHTELDDVPNTAKNDSLLGVVSGATVAVGVPSLDISPDALMSRSPASTSARGSGSRDNFSPRCGLHHLEHLRKGQRRTCHSADDHHRGAGARLQWQQQQQQQQQQQHGGPGGSVPTAMRPTSGMHVSLAAMPEDARLPSDPVLCLNLSQLQDHNGEAAVNTMMPRSASFESSSTFGVALDSPPIRPLPDPSVECSWTKATLQTPPHLSLAAAAHELRTPEGPPISAD